MPALRTGPRRIRSGNVVFRVDIPDKGAGFVPVKRRNASKNTALIVALAAGGSSVTGKVNIDRAWLVRS